MYDNVMYNLVVSKWNDILEILKKEHDIMDVSFNTWIKPLDVYSVEDNVITLLVPEILKNQKKGLDKFLYGTAITTFLVVYYTMSLRSGYLNIVPYRFFWT